MHCIPNISLIQKMEETGELHVTCGCMFAGKSTEAVTMIRRWRSIDVPVFVVKHRLDVRYGKTEAIYTHDSPAPMYPSLATDALMPVLASPEFKAAKIVIIEEAQFFDDLYVFCQEAVDVHAKIVNVFGLDGNSRREPFGQMHLLLPIAETFTKTRAFCKSCHDGTLASFTSCVDVLPDSGVLIGGSDVYSAVCRYHYHYNNSSV